MLVISPNYSLSLYQSDQTLGTKRSTDDDPGKKDIPFIWYDFSSFSRLGKKPADHFQLLHTICPSVKQSLGPGIFCHPIASQPATEVHSRPVCVGWPPPVVLRVGEDLVLCILFFACQHPTTIKLDQDSAGRYFRDAFIHLFGLVRGFSPTFWGMFFSLDGRLDAAPYR